MLLLRHTKRQWKSYLMAMSIRVHCRNFVRKENMGRIIKFAEKVPGCVLIIMGIIWKYAVDILFQSFSSEQLGGNVPTDIYSMDFIMHEFIAIVFAPFVETFIYQFVPIELFLHFTRNKDFRYKLVWAAIIASILFGLAHSYNLLTQIATMISGFALSATYVVFRKRNNSIGTGYLMTVLLHFLVNASILIIRLV